MTTQTPSFLQGGGEMGAITRAYDWNSSPLGDPDTWPQSLRTTVSIILSSRFPMFLWWGEELIQFYNDAYRSSMGNEGKHPKALGQKGKDCWPEIWDIIYPLINHVMTTGEATWSEDQLIPIYRNGQLEDVYWTFGYSPVRDESGAINGVLVVCNETTEKIKSAQNLQTSQQRFQNLIREATVSIIVVTGAQMKIAIVNNAYAALIGRNSEDLIGKNIFDVIPNASPGFKKTIQGVYDSGEPALLYDKFYSITVNGQKKEGFLNIIYQPYREADGTISGVMVLCQDVTEQMNTRKELVASEARLKALVTNSPVAICLFTGRDLVIEMPNQAFIDLVGKGDISGMPLAKAMPELLTENQPFLQILDDVYTNGCMFQTSGAMVKVLKAGIMTEDYYDFTYTPLLDDHGQVYAILEMAVNVTDQVLARQRIEEMVTERTRELAEANILLQKSNEELAQFAYIASHDLQEPLRKVSTFTQMLELNLPDPDDRIRNYLGKINNSVSRMSTLIKDVLTYSRLSGTDQFREVDLRKVFNELMTDFELVIEQKRAKIRYAELPVIVAIPLQMSQLFANLLSNALKYSRQEVPPEITITATLLPVSALSLYPFLDPGITYHKITVQDNGIGFKQEYAEQIFNIFQRLHGQSEYSGTGIGLAICKKIVQNHKGHISVSSDINSGTLFEVLLPQSAVTLPAEKLSGRFKKS